VEEAVLNAEEVQAAEGKRLSLVNKIKMHYDLHWQ